MQRQKVVSLDNPKNVLNISAHVAVKVQSHEFNAYLRVLRGLTVT